MSIFNKFFNKDESNTIEEIKNVVLQAKVLKVEEIDSDTTLIKILQETFASLKKLMKEKEEHLKEKKAFINEQNSFVKERQILAKDIQELVDKEDELKNIIKQKSRSIEEINIKLEKENAEKELFKDESSSLLKEKEKIESNFKEIPLKATGVNSFGSFSSVKSIIPPSTSVTSITFSKESFKILFNSSELFTFFAIAFIAVNLLIIFA